MIKGAILIGIGFGLGYAKAMSDQEEIRGAAVAFKHFLDDFALQEEIKKKEERDRQAGVVDVPAEEVTEVPEPDEEESETPS